MIPLIAVKYVGKHLKKKKSKRKLSNPTTIAAGIGVIFASVLVMTFASASSDDPELALVSMDGNIPIVQSSAASRYVQAKSPLASGIGRPTTIDLSSAYIDAVEAVPDYNMSFVQSTNSIIVGVNSPTKDPTANAYVVNLIPLMKAEVNDLIGFEKSLGVTGHRDVEEYVLEQLKVKNSCLSNNGYSYTSAYSGVIGGVGPAITIRDFYMNERWKDWGTTFWDVFGGRDEAYIDVMWVADKDVQAYLAGKDVDVTYMQVKLVDAKGHNAPWGLNQTHFYMNYATDQMQPQHDAGSPASKCIGGAPEGGDEVANLKELLKVAKANETSPGVYIWPTLEATAKDLGMNFIVKPETFSMPAATWNVLECGGNNGTNVQVPTVFANCTMIGILVYAA